MERCNSVLTTELNVHCIKGPDVSDRTSYLRPIDELEKDPQYAEFSVAGNKAGHMNRDLDTLARYALLGIGGDVRAGKSNYAFLYLYRKRQAGTSIPVTFGELFTRTVDPNYSGVGYQADESIVSTISTAAVGIGLFGPKTEEAQAIVAAAAQREEDGRERNRQQGAKLKAASQPKCTEVAITGYATVFPEELAALVQSGAPGNFAARRPLLCEDSSWGGHTVNGGVVNRSYQSACRGVVHLVSQRAKVLDWDEATFRVSTEVRMDTGPRAMVLFVQRNSASCNLK
jgi:hypothetical protein